MNACFEEMLQHRKSLLDGALRKMTAKDDYPTLDAFHAALRTTLRYRPADPQGGRAVPADDLRDGLQSWVRPRLPVMWIPT